MKKLLGILVLGLLLSTSAYTDDIKDFQIERISIGDSALNYFSEAQLEDNELDPLILKHVSYFFLNNA